MLSKWQYQLFADIVLSFHFAVVIFVVFGLFLVVAGNLYGWKWVNALWFRVVHLSAITIVVLQSWLGEVCPLTILELWLREKYGAGRYNASFIEYWLKRLLFYEAPPWIFVAVYTLFGLIVFATWFLFPPGRKDTEKRRNSKPIG